jgi:hypothetical protein
MPPKEPCSPINSPKRSESPGISPASMSERKVTHTASWGPPTNERSDQKTGSRPDRNLSDPDPFPARSRSVSDKR